jgi:hypothetical protein
VIFPKNFKGFKVQANSEAFGTPSLSLHPPNFQSYITQLERKNQDYFSRPSQYGKTKLDFMLGKKGNSREPEEAAQQESVQKDKHSEQPDVWLQSQGHLHG